MTAGPTVEGSSVLWNCRFHIPSIVGAVGAIVPSGDYANISVMLATHRLVQSDPQIFDPVVRVHEFAQPSATRFDQISADHFVSEFFDFCISGQILVEAIEILQPGRERYLVAPSQDEFLQKVDFTINREDRTGIRS